jgi:hypothetical protein
MIAHLFPHEHGIGADIDDSRLFEEPFHQFLDFRVNQRFSATNGNHGGVALDG